MYIKRCVTCFFKLKVCYMQKIGHDVISISVHSKLIVDALLSHLGWPHQSISCGHLQEWLMLSSLRTGINIYFKSFSKETILTNF